MVYFLQSEYGGHIKIGSSIRLSQRIKQVQSIRREKLVVLGVIDGGLEREREIQARFNHIRSEGHRYNEWFVDTSELLDFILTEARSWDGKDEAAEVLPPRSPNATARPKDRIGMRLDISKEYRARMRIAAASRGQSLAAYARSVVMDAVDRDWPETEEIQNNSQATS